jgi:hypothetical protein
MLSIIIASVLLNNPEQFPCWAINPSWPETKRWCYQDACDAYQTGGNACLSIQDEELRKACLALNEYEYDEAIDGCNIAMVVFKNSLSDQNIELLMQYD